MNLSQLGEFGLIEKISKLIGKPSGKVKLGIGDDCAVLELPCSTTQFRINDQSKNYQLITTDALVEGVHFHKNESYFHLGQKAMLANVSDISAMGGWPTFAVVSIGLSEHQNIRDVKQLYKGMLMAAKQHGIQIVGGDTVAAPQMIISITLLGEVEKECLVTRSGAKIGDVICVTGCFGGPAAKKFRTTTIQCRINEARSIATKGIASSMIDSSDGLVRSVREICKASKVDALVKAEAVPRAKVATLDQALYGGEEYELVFTCRRTKVPKFAKVVGEIVAKGKGNLADFRAGFDHFK